MLLLIPKLNGFGPDPLKDQLQQHNVYALFSQILQQSSSGSEGSQAEITDQALLVFRSALTPEYIENKSSEVIDDSAAWLTGPQEQPPSVSFNDIKEEVITAYPEAQLQIHDLTRQLKSAQQDLEGKEITPDGVPGINGDGSASSEEIAEMLKQAESLDNFASGDFRLELKSMLEPIRNVFEAYILALPILGVALLLLATAMMALGSGWPSRLKWVGWVFVISATFNILLSLLFSVAILSTGLDILVGMIPTQANFAWIRSSPTAAAASIASAISPASKTPRCLIEFAQIPARQSACNSISMDN